MKKETGFVTNAEKATTDAHEWAETALEHLDTGHTTSATIEAQVAQALALVSIADSLLALREMLKEVITPQTLTDDYGQIYDRVHGIRIIQ